MAYTREEISKADVETQFSICETIKIKNSAKDEKPKAMIDTYGCQQNIADSERLRGYMLAMGFEMTDNEREASLIVVNTCAIREHAEMRVLGNVGALNHCKKRNPELVVAVCGCMVQQEHMAEKLHKSFPVVDLVFGPHELWKFPELYSKVKVKKGKKSGRKRVFAAISSEGNIAEGLPMKRDGEFKAWLSIMYGCNNYCTYCVVPYVRGRERSRHVEDILAEARMLIADGVKEITLLGQNVNSYGRDLDENVDFADLLRLINDLDGDFLIRFMTSHPKDATEKLYKTMADCKKVARQLHLPVQSGSSAVLKAMNRNYTREHYLGLVEMARRYMPDIVLTTDIIVGFPQETEDQFEETLSLAETVRYDGMFTFIYSPRVGTPAASMDDPVEASEKQLWFSRLLEVGNRISGEKHAEYHGKTIRVLVEGEAHKGDYNLAARTNGGRLVKLNGDLSLAGKFVEVKITGSNNWALNGEIV